MEIEAAKLHGGWAAWCRLTPQERGKLMAHEALKGMRMHYEMDVRPDPTKENGAAKPLGYEFRERYFGGSPKL